MTHDDLAVAEAPVVSVLVVAWRDAPHLAACLASLADLGDAVPFEVVVCANEPTAATTAVLAESPAVRVVASRVNLGYGGAVNLAASRARGDVLVLLNDDAVVTTGWLEALLDTMDRRAAVAVGSTARFPDGTIQEQGSVIWSDGTTTKVGRGLPSASREYDYERRVEHASGTSLAIRRDRFVALGGMDDRYYPAYYEDTDLCLRILADGGEIWFQPRSVVVHQESASTGSTYRAFLFDRNHRIFAERWGARLVGHVDPGDRGPTLVAEATWRAAGAPLRVLLCGRRRDLDVAVPACGDAFVRLVAVDDAASSDRSWVESWSRRGVAVSEAATLGSELADANHRYDVVVVIGDAPRGLQTDAPVVVAEAGPGLRDDVARAVGARVRAVARS